MDGSKLEATAPQTAPAPGDEHLTAAETPAESTTQETSISTTSEDVSKTQPANGTANSNGEVSANGANGTNGAAPALECDISNRPKDFVGQVATNNELPSPSALKKVENYVLLDQHGKTHTFKSLYAGPNVARRVLVIFVRHFFCGNCQEYLRTLSESITPEALLQLPISTFITVVGCGDPRLIDMYVEATGCRFPVYTDPNAKLFGALGMVKTLALGPRPAYMKKGITRSSLESVVQGLKQLRNGLALKSGDQRQVGGEFLFEPYDIATPATSPLDGPPQVAPGEEKKITWCHRMTNTRDHAEMPELMEVLGLDGQGKPIKDRELWSKALATRKGTGLSLASQMGQLGEAQAEAS